MPRVGEHFKGVENFAVLHEGDGHCLVTKKWALQGQNVLSAQSLQGTQNSLPTRTAQIRCQLNTEQKNYPIKSVHVQLGRSAIHIMQEIGNTVGNWECGTHGKLEHPKCSSCVISPMHLLQKVENVVPPGNREMGETASHPGA